MTFPTILKVRMTSTQEPIKTLGAVVKMNHNDDVVAI